MVIFDFEKKVDIRRKILWEYPQFRGQLLYNTTYKMAEDQNAKRLKEFTKWKLQERGIIPSTPTQQTQGNSGLTAEQQNLKDWTKNKLQEKWILPWINQGTQTATTTTTLPWITNFQNLQESNKIQFWSNVKSNIILPWISEPKYPNATLSQATQETGKEWNKRAKNNVKDTRSMNEIIHDEMVSGEYIPLLKQWAKQTWNDVKKFAYRKWIEAVENFANHPYETFLWSSPVLKALWTELDKKRFEDPNVKSQVDKWISNMWKLYYRYEDKINKNFDKWVDQNMNKIITKEYQDSGWIFESIKKWDTNMIKYGLVQWFSTSVVPMIPWIIAWIVTKNPAVTAGIAFASTAPIEDQEAYEESIKEWATRDEADVIWKYAWIINWALETVWEFLQLKGLLKPLKKNIAKEITKKTTRQIIARWLLERNKGVFWEALTEWTQEFVTNALIKTINENRDIFAWVLDSMIVWWVLWWGWSTLWAWGKVIEDVENNKKIDLATDIEALNYVMQWEERKAQRMQEKEEEQREKIKQKILSRRKANTWWEIEEIDNQDIGESEVQQTWQEIEESQIEDEMIDEVLNEENDMWDSKYQKNGDTVRSSDQQEAEGLRIDSNSNKWKVTITNENASEFSKKLDEIKNELEWLKADTFLERIKNSISWNQKTNYIINKNTDRKYVLRISSHHANAYNARWNKAGTTSIVIKLMEAPKFKKDNKVNLTEFVYDPANMTTEKMQGIIDGIENWIFTGKYTDTKFDSKNESIKKKWENKQSNTWEKHQLKYEEKWYTPWVANKKEKNISGKEWIKQKNTINDETIEQLAEKYWVKVEVIKWMIEILKKWKGGIVIKDWEAYWKYRDQLLTLSEQIKESTAPHELLHAIFDMIDPETKTYLIAQVMKSEGWNAETAEERLADSFSNFFRTGKIEWAPKSTWWRIKIFFKRVRSFINGMNKWRNELDEIFTDIITADGIVDLQSKIDESSRLNKSKEKMRKRFMEYRKNAIKMQKKAEKTNKKKTPKNWDKSEKFQIADENVFRRQSDLRVDQMERRIIEEYGTTDNPSRVAFISNNGEWINGNMWWYGNYRDVDHREIAQTWFDDTDIEFDNGTEALVALQAQTWMVRVNYNDGYMNIDTVYRLNWNQEESLMKFEDDMIREVYVDITDPKTWRVVDGGTFTSVEEAINYIDNYFVNNEEKYQEAWDINSEEFKKRFWNSKIVNEDWSPKIMYHWTPTRFTIFDKSKIWDNTGNYGYSWDGFYFTDSKDYAWSYGNNVMEVYLKVEKPFTFTKENIKKYAKYLAWVEQWHVSLDKDWVLKELKRNDEKSYDFAMKRLDNPDNAWKTTPYPYDMKYDPNNIVDLLRETERDGRGYEFESVNLDYFEWFWEPKYKDDVYYYPSDPAYMMWLWEYSNQEFIDAIRKDWFDGIITFWEVVVFDSNQIKSATDNVGTYDENNDDIRYQKMDDEYAEAVENWNTTRAKAILREYAKEKGYDSSTDYQWSLAFNGSAPASDGLTKEERVSGNEDIYSQTLWDFASDGLDWWDLGRQLDPNWWLGIARSRASRWVAWWVYDLESINNLRNAVMEYKKWNKDVKIRMYRAIDSDIKEEKFRNWDWITPSKEYAKHHIDLQDWKKGRVISEDVSIEDIRWDGNDINERWFDNEKEYGYKDTPNNRKELEITYDDNGNLIPLSERFNENVEDERYQRVYHWSPADFDRFDSSHMWEWEWAQAHGWWHYVAVDEKTGRHYAQLHQWDLYSNIMYKWESTRDMTRRWIDREDVNQVAPSDIMTSIVDGISRGKYDESMKVSDIAKDIINQRIEVYSNSYERSWDWIKNAETPEEKAEMQRRADRLRDLIKAYKDLDEKDFDRPQRNLYEVEIPDPIKKDTPTWENYLEENGEITKAQMDKIYDEVVKEYEKKKQWKAKRVQNLQDGRLKTFRNLIDQAPWMLSDWKWLYSTLSNVLWWQEQASKFLESLGYDWIHYFWWRDGEAYVIFNDNALEIKNHERYQKAWDINSPAFKKRFGDSKVVDKDGNPLVVYHGTANKFTAFSKEMIWSNFNQDIQWFFFTDSKESAEDYANNTSYWLPRNQKWNVMEVYLSIQNPLIKNIDYDPIELRDNNYERFIKEANNKWADGIIIKADEWQSMYIPFNPNQIKSATDNAGTYDPNNDDIRYQRKDSEGNSLSEWQIKYFENSKIRKDWKLLVVYHWTHWDFTIFDRKKIWSKTNNKWIFWEWFYFTSNKKYWDYYAQPQRSKEYQALEWKTKEDIEKMRWKTMKWYLNITNPFYWRSIKTPNAVKKLIETLWLGKNDLERNSTLNNQMRPITDAKKAIKFRNALEKAWYDWIIYEYDGADKDGNKQDEIVAFYSNQFKNIDNKNPTDNDDIRFQKAWNTKSANFKKRFDGSKVVKEDGKPQIVYHGTTAEFTVFNKIASRGIFWDGYYFTNRIWTARQYGYGRDGRVMKVYLAIKNPYVADNGDGYFLNTGKLKEEWYDGVQAIMWSETYWVAFDSNQIKSATDNVGTYDPNNDDIRYQITEYEYDENGNRKWIKFWDNSEFDPNVFWTPTKEGQIEEDKEKEKSNPFYNAWIKYNNQNYKDDQLTLWEFVDALGAWWERKQEEFDKRKNDIAEVENDPKMLELQLKAVKLAEEETNVGKKFWKNVSKEVRDRQQAEVEKKREDLSKEIFEWMYPWLRFEEATYDDTNSAWNKEAEWEMLGREKIEEKLRYFKKDSNGNWEKKNIKLETPQEQREKIEKSWNFDEVIAPSDRVIEWKTPEWQKGRLDKAKDPKQFKKVMEKINSWKSKTKVELKDVTNEVRALERYKENEKAEKERRKKEKQEEYAKKKQEEYKRNVRLKAFQRLVDMQRFEKFTFLTEDEIKQRWWFTDEEWKKITEQLDLWYPPKKRNEKAVSDFNKAVDSEVKFIIEGLSRQNNMKKREAEKNLGEIWEIDLDVLLGKDEEKWQKEVEEFERISEEEKKKSKKEKNKRLEQAREDVTQVEIDKERENSKSEKERVDKIIKSTKSDNTVWWSIKKTASDIITPVSTRIREISPKIYRETMRYFQNKDILTNQRLKEIDPFLKAMWKIRKENPVRFMDIWVALANRNIGYANGLLQEYGVKVPTKLLDTIFDEAEDVWLNINYLWSYYPLSVKAPKSFLEELMKVGNGDIASEIEKKIQQESQKKWWPLEESEITAIINSVIAWEEKWPDVNLGNKHLKKRNTEIERTPKMLEYCDDPISTLITYIEWMTDKIERAKFLWKSRSWNVHTLADYVYNAKNGLTAEQQDELMELLKSVFNDASPNKFYQTWRDIATLTTLWSPSSTLTQIGDLSFSIYENWWREALKATWDIFMKRKAFDLKDMWVINRWEEYTNINSQKNLLQKAIHNVFKLTFFSNFDTFWKSTFIQSTWNKRRKRALKWENWDPQLIKDIMKITDDEYTTMKIINDLRNWVFSEDVALVMYMKLGNIQPLTKAQMPKAYLDNPNGRLFYQFKTFGIKQLDYVLQETKQQIKWFKNLSTTEKFLRVAQVANMIFIMTLMWAWASELKDITMRRRSNSLILRWLFGEEVWSEQIWDKIWDSALQLFWLSRYTVMQMKSDPVDAITSLFTTFPATNLVTYPFKDIVKAFKNDGSINWRNPSAYQLIPVIWKYRYWIYWGGQDKQQEALDKEKKTTTSGWSSRSTRTTRNTRSSRSRRNTR